MGNRTWACTGIGEGVVLSDGVTRTAENGGGVVLVSRRASSPTALDTRERVCGETPLMRRAWTATGR